MKRTVKLAEKFIKEWKFQRTKYKIQNTNEEIIDIILADKKQIKENVFDKNCYKENFEQPFVHLIRYLP
jgi:hypothetical protein